MKSCQRRKSEAGVIFITTLLLMTLLMALSVSGLGLSRSDLLVSQNLLTGTQALWTARAGLEVGKNWLEENLPGAVLPVSLGPTAFGDGDYSVTIETLGAHSFRLTAVGRGPSESRRVVEETVRLPDFTPAGVITSDRDGLHPDFDDNSGGVGRRIPDFSVDGRNHAPDGSLSPLCPAIAPFAAAQAAAQHDLTSAADILRREIVTRANSFCQADGSDAAGPCTPGLFWVRGGGVLPRFHTGPCVMTDPTCFLTLDLSAAALRALANPPAAHPPPAPDDRGPLGPGPGPAPLVRLLTAMEQSRLQTAVNDMLQRVAELPEEMVLHITTSLHAGRYEYGSMHEPAVVQIDDGVGAIEIDGGATLDGVGVLIIPRPVHLGNAAFNWKGLIVVTGAGDLSAVDAALCGQVFGAVLAHDDAALDRKLDFDKVQRGGGCAPLTINYSCEMVTRALTTLMRTVSWVEKYGA
ncbi:MAG TPA: hypothetical protein VNN62_24960 [Methylomirabilota bacterium]|nr:hypothetical protein [Methylomirabilota bacterium]